MLPLYDPVLNLPPPAPLPSLTLNPNGTLYLTKPLMVELDLEAGDAIGLVPPVLGSMYWHLDLRKSAPYKIEWSGSVSTAVRAQSPRVRAIKLLAGLVAAPLRLLLVREKQTHPDYYPLLSHHAFTT